MSKKSTSGSGSKSSKSAPLYIPERFEVIVPPSTPDTLPPIHLNEMPYEEVPPARATRALNELFAAIARVDSGISKVVSMREQQAGFVTCQLNLLEQLKEEAATLSTEMEARRDELQTLEGEIAKHEKENVQR